MSFSFRFDSIVSFNDLCVIFITTYAVLAYPGFIYISRLRGLLPEEASKSLLAKRLNDYKTLRTKI